MTAKKKKENQYNISDIHMTNHIISWENHTVRIPEVAQIWIGSMPSRPFPANLLLIPLFLTLSSRHPVNFLIMSVLLAIITAMVIYSHRPAKTGTQVYARLHSGSILSFTSDNDTSVSQFYDAMKQAAEGSIKADISFDTDGNIVQNADEEAKEPAPAAADINSRNVQHNPLLAELQKLYQCFTEKTDANSEVLELINKTARMVEAGNRDGLKSEFEHFVTLGLIGDCNVLGLESLIQEIKSSLY